MVIAQERAEVSQEFRSFKKKIEVTISSETQKQWVDISRFFMILTDTTNSSLGTQEYNCCNKE